MSSSDVSGFDVEDFSSSDLRLIAKDGKEFSLPRKFALISTLVKTSLDSDASATELEIPGVKGDVLARVVDYLQHCKGLEPAIVEKPLRSKIMKEVCKDPWDAEFIDKIGENRQILYDLVMVRKHEEKLRRVGQAA